LKPATLARQVKVAQSLESLLGAGPPSWRNDTLAILALSSLAKPLPKQRVPFWKRKLGFVWLYARPNASGAQALEAAGNGRAARLANRGFQGELYWLGQVRLCLAIAPAGESRPNACRSLSGGDNGFWALRFSSFAIAFLMVFAVAPLRKRFVTVFLRKVKLFS
jgi:hypothetical protein